MRRDGRFYRHAGGFDPSQLPLAVLAGATAILVMGVVYGYVIRYSPLIYLNILALLGFGYGVGWTVGNAVRKGKCRNRTLRDFLWLVAVVSALYVSWVTWVFAITGHQHLILDPRSLWHALVFIGKKGVWSIGSSGIPVSGILLYLVWVAEAIILAVMAWTTSMDQDPGPFCEACGQWVAPMARLPRLGFTHATDRNSGLKAMGAGEIDPLFSLGPCADDCKIWLSVLLEACPSREHLIVLTVTQTVQTTNGKGEVANKVTSIMRNRLVDPETCARIIEWFQSNAPEPEPADGTPEEPEPAVAESE